MFEKQIEKIKAKLSEMAKRAAPVDPSLFNHPVALKTEWTPLKGGGANFKTHVMVEKEHYRYEFRSSAVNYIFGFVFAIIGGGIPLFMVLAILMEEGLSPVMLFPLLMSALFVGIGTWLIRSATKPIVFDKHSGYFWKGRVDPISVYDRSKIKEYCELVRISGLQIIREWVRGDKSSYYSYELNLVLDDGSRLNVVDHGNANKLVADAQRLSAFLGVPLWDPGSLN